MGSDRLVVEKPEPLADRPSWVKVGVIAALGFVIGIAWPRLAGLRPGPSVPDPTTLAASGRPADSAPAIAAEAPGPSLAAVNSTATPPSSAAPPASAKSTADGETQVVWPVALIRDTPKTGQVIARLPRGTRLRVGASKDGWYPVKYGDDFGSEGWVYRGAIAK
jgi:hypothetical protein